MTQTTVTHDGLSMGRVRLLTDTPSTDYRRGGPSIPPTGGGDDPPGHRPGGGRGDDDGPGRLELAALAAIVTLQLLLLVALSLLQARIR